MKSITRTAALIASASLVAGTALAQVETVEVSAATTNKSVKSIIVRAGAADEAGARIVREFPLPAVRGSVSFVRDEAGEEAYKPVAYLGVVVIDAGKDLTQHLGLPDGVGLLVQEVRDESPAKSAGLEKNDLLHKLNDQLLINPDQLATLVRTFKDGDEISLHVIRKGQPTELKAKLVERDMPELSNDWETQFNMGDQEGLAALARIARNAPPAAAPGRMISIGSELVIARRGNVDGDEVTVETRNGKTTVNIADKDGNQIYHSDYNTDEEKEKLPAKYKQAVERMMTRGTVDVLKLGPLNAPPDAVETPAAPEAAPAAPTSQPTSMAPKLELDPKIV
jgi:hypothetical protein